MNVTQLPCIWRSPYTTCTLLNLGTAAPAYPIAISPDGSTVYGTANFSGLLKAVKWNTSTLAMTVLDNSAAPTTNLMACAASDDGSVIYGGQPDSSLGPPSAQGLGGIMVRWTGGGATSTLVPNPGTTLAVTWLTDMQGPGRMCSANGVVMAAHVDTGAGPYAWTNNVAALLPGGSATYNMSRCVSSDGSRVFGFVGGNTSYAGYVPSYWTGGVRHAMSNTAFFPGTIYGCNSDGSALWGIQAGGQTCCYWSVSDGVQHQLNTLPGWDGAWSRPQIGWIADDPGTLIAVGGCPATTHTASPTVQHATKWTGTSVVDLGLDTSGRSDLFAVATGCNHDGTVICGYSGLTSSVPLRWDSSNTLHVLPTLADSNTGLGWYGQALGISRDASVIFGLTAVAGGTPPPPSPSSLAMDSIIATDLTPATVAGSQIFLMWSDDRGHSYGSPVGQSIGRPGAYLTSPQWQRLGYARDRVFKLEWSVQVATALQGAFIEVDAQAKS